MWERCDFLKSEMYLNFIIVKYINDLKGQCSSYSIQHQLMQRCDVTHIKFQHFACENFLSY